MAAGFNRQILGEIAHRPWPMPDRPWIMTQTWNDLLFAHWPIDPATMRSKVPSEFELDLFEAHAWLGVVPFYMTNVAPRGIPAIPWLSAFAELNVRTYVRVADRPGVYFFSLDAANPLAVHAARIWLNLPYYSASMTLAARAGAIEYRSHRSGERTAAFVATYEPSGPAGEPPHGSLEYFLTERYCLYATDRRARPYRLEIHHPPWRLQAAEASVERNTMADAAGISLPARPPLLHFSRRQDMVAWAPAPIDSR
jgi:uncharacterized protein YqjF (DUF2071 family)